MPRRNRGVFVKVVNDVEHWAYDFSIQKKRFRGTIAPVKSMHRRTANSKLREIKVDAANGVYQKANKPPEQVPTSEIFERYETYLKHFRPATWRSYRYNCSHFVNFFKKKNPVTRKHITAYIDKRLNEKTKRDTPVSGATINREMAYCRAAFNAKYDSDLRDKIGNNPFKGIPKFPENERVRYLKPSELKALLSKCDKDLKDIVKLAILTGLRKRNILGLNKSQIDLHNGLLTVKAEDHKGNGNRSFPLQGEAAEICKRRLKASKSGYLFESKRKPGSPLVNIDKGWYTALSDAGIADFRFHDLRHTFATYNLLKTGNVRLVQANLEHSRITTTQKYAHIITEEQKAGSQATSDFIMSILDKAPQDEDKSSKQDDAGSDTLSDTAD